MAIIINVCVCVYVCVCACMCVCVDGFKVSIPKNSGLSLALFKFTIMKGKKNWKKEIANSKVIS